MTTSPKTTRHVAVAAALLGIVLASPLAGQRRTDPRMDAEIAKRRTRTYAECAQRHLDLGLWARKKGLVPQATLEFLRAVEIGKGHHGPAETVLGLMREHGPDFWRGERKTFLKGLLANYAKRRAAIDERDIADRYVFARFLHQQGQADEAVEVFIELIDEAVDSVLEIDDKNRVVLPPGPVPDDLTDRLTKGAIQIGKRVYRNTPVLERLRGIEGIVEVEDEHLRIRGTLPREVLAELLAIGKAAFPLLAERFRAQPTRRIEVVVLADRKDYVELLGEELEIYHKAQAVSEPEALRAMLCAERIVSASAATANDALRGLLLHELTHLFDVTSAPTVMPSWYREGVAESFGGVGAFRWDGETLEVGRVIARERLKACADRVEGGFELGKFLGDDIVRHLESGDMGRVAAFRTTAWALDRFLRTADPDLADKYSLWETSCRGRAVGVGDDDEEDDDKGRKSKGGGGGKKGDDPEDLPWALRRAPLASKLFREVLGGDTARIEADFPLWVRRMAESDG